MFKKMYKKNLLKYLFEPAVLSHNLRSIIHGRVRKVSKRYLPMLNVA